MSLIRPWDRALLCLKLLEIDPTLGGIVIASRSSPVRDRLLRHLPKSTHRIHGQMDDTALFGGMDVTSTLSKGAVVMTSGIAVNDDPLLLTMAERTPNERAVRLVSETDSILYVLDESTEDEDLLPPVFTEQLAFHIDLKDLSLSDARSMPAEVVPSDTISTDQAIELFAQTSATLGITSLRAPSFALKAARALARLDGRSEITQDDANTAAMLVFAHRTTRLPEFETEPEEPEAPAEPKQNPQNEIVPEDMMIEAVKMLLPNDVLLFLNGTSRTGKGRGAGRVRKSNRRGRPKPSRKGNPDSQTRLDVIATLRSAAPMQGLRANAARRTAIQIRSSDLHVKQFEEKSDRLIIFVVDASGSSAVGRLAEAKGAVEYLLADAYARRDHVALVAFRGEAAELLLPPTRSLVQTKRRLASLPGGGGTPLASGIEQGLMQAISGQRKGMTPVICILTDGRANIARDGSPDRQAAAQDAKDMAKQIRGLGFDSIVIDTGNRPEPQLRTLSSIMDASYISLPRANASGISKAVSSAIAD